MLENPDIITWPTLARAYGKAERALGRLAHALESTPLHATWLWREITRTAVTIAQTRGYKVSVDQLRRALIGAPIERDDNTTGLAAAKRIFLAAAPLFRAPKSTDSDDALWPRFWQTERVQDDDGGAAAPGADGRSEADSDALPGDDDPGRPGEREQRQLLGLVRELSSFADDGRRPALINLLVDLRKHAAVRSLPPPLVRLALPLAIKEAGLLPKQAPGLLGGRRLALGMSSASTEVKPLTDWLTSGLDELSKEADQAHRRLAELTRQHRAWHGALIGEGMRKHARAPRALDLLAATPVLSISLVARHIGCSHVAAGKIVAKLADLGILLSMTSRSRHKIYLAGDLARQHDGEALAEAPLDLSAPAPAVDVDAVGATLDGLFADLERLNERARDRTRAGGVTTAGE